MLRRVKVSDALLRALALLFFMLSLLVGGVYLIIFLNPYVPINPFPPPSPQPVARLTPEGPILEITFPPLNPSEPSANEGGKNQGGAGGIRHPALMSFILHYPPLKAIIKPEL